MCMCIYITCIGSHGCAGAMLIMFGLYNSEVFFCSVHLLSVLDLDMSNKQHNCIIAAMPYLKSTPHCLTALG